MKEFRKSTRIIYWVLRILAISSALLLFSVIGIVALQTATHATAATISTPIPPSPISTIPVTTPTPVLSPTTVINPTATPKPTPTPTPTPKPTPTPAPKPTAVSTHTPIVFPTATSAAPGAASPLPPPIIKETPKALPSPTPRSSPTPLSTGTPTKISAQRSTLIPSKTQPDAQSGSKNGTMATIKRLIGPIAGVSTTILLIAAGLFAFMLWRKSAPGVTYPFQASPVQSAAAVVGQQASSAYDQATESSPVLNKTMSPFVMQSIVQYSPLLGALDTSQADAPVPPTPGNFRPLLVDYPQLLEVHTDKTSIPVTPATQPSISIPIEVEEYQLASTPLSPMPPVASTFTASAQTPISPTQPDDPTAYQFPQHDSIMETLMQKVQMGIFSLPGK